MLLLIHDEIDKPRALVTEREYALLPTFKRLASDFPNLKMVLEHVSTKDVVELVSNLGDNVAAIITTTVYT